ncbi:TraR/DksA family transcriptional regulator [Ancylomarina longa]|uniref:TraR/DksA family transcriptional regulator n=1 Tax=Ancylomarina longa TaxID=2487017 RepID=A0A434ATF4_9BACT|nr:TraR/DksA C4-type zinc finger protein [Ancylomarina longa]RUT77686.1 TraR/DksA family transcriptional regulator [Ancylomarina longa]
MQNINKTEILHQIQRKLETLELEILELKEVTKPIAPDCAIGRISRMDAINNKSVSEAALRKKKIQFSALKDALKSIDSPDFGKCIKCGKSIPLGRIMIMPESKKCVNCANK